MKYYLYIRIRVKAESRTKWNAYIPSLCTDRLSM
jgi:hypothetical protein